MKRFIYIIALAFAAISAQSCLFEQKDLFDKSPAERLEAYNSEYKELLMSAENGWFLEYWPDETQQYGGYLYSLEFGTNEVSVKSELADNCSEAEISYYKLTLDDGPTITFDTYNTLLHYFADPNPSDYEALHGDYEFNIMGKSTDETEIYIRGKKTGNKMVLKKIADDFDFVEYVGECNAVAAQVAAPSYSFEFPLEYEYETIGSIKNHALTLKCVYYVPVEKPNQGDQVEMAPEEDGEEAGDDEEEEIKYDTKTMEITLPFIYYVTPEESGLRLYKEATFNGITFDRLILVPGDGADNPTTIATPDGKLVITPIIPPLNVLFTISDWFITYENVGAWGKPYFDRADQVLKESEGEEVTLMFMGRGSTISSSYTDDWGFTFRVDAGYGGQLKYITECIGEDKVSLQFAMAGQGDGVYYHNNCEFHRYLNVFGYSSARIFTVTADDPAFPSYILLTEDANPSNTIKLLRDVVFYK